MVKFLVTLMFAGAVAHEEFHGVCPIEMDSIGFAENLLGCFENSVEGINPSESCVDDALREIVLDDPACLKCIEHFVEDHFIEEVSRCPEEYLTIGKNRDKCVSVIVDAIGQNCY